MTENISLFGFLGDIRIVTLLEYYPFFIDKQKMYEGV